MNFIGILSALVVSATSAFGAVHPGHTGPKGLLTPPTTYQSRIYNYNGAWSIRDNVGAGAFEPLDFSRVADSTYYTYSTVAEVSSDYLPEGITISLSFARSNTTWAETSTGSGVWRNSSTSIGSSVATTTSLKVNIQVYNRSVSDYELIVDGSSAGGSRAYTALGRLINTANTQIYTQTRHTSSTSLSSAHVIPAGTYYNLYSSATSSIVNIDALYFNRYQTSAAITNNGDDDFYDAGLQDGFDKTLDGFTLLDGFESVMGVLINFVFVFLGLEVLGISLFDLFGVVLVVIVMVWFFKLIKGGS